MCERKHSTQFRVVVYFNGRFLGETFHWDKASANRTFDKQIKKIGVSATMYDPDGKKIRS